MRSLPTKPVVTQPAKRQRNANPSTPLTHIERQSLRDAQMARWAREFACSCWSK